MEKTENRNFAFHSTWQCTDAYIYIYISIADILMAARVMFRKSHTLHHKSHTLHHKSHTLHHESHTLYHKSHTLYHKSHTPQPASSFSLWALSDTDMIHVRSLVQIKVSMALNSSPPDGTDDRKRKTQSYYWPRPEFDCSSQLFIDLLKAYSLVNRTGSPRGFHTLKYRTSRIQYKTSTLHTRKTYKHNPKVSPFGIALVKNDK